MRRTGLLTASSKNPVKYIDLGGHNTTGSAIPLPAYQTGDLLVLMAFNPNGAVSLTPPAGWDTLMEREDVSAGSASGVYAKIAGSSEGTISMAGTGTPGTQKSFQIMSLRNASLVPRQSKAFSYGPYGLIYVADLEDALEGDLVLAAQLALDSGAGNIPTPTGMTEVRDQSVRPAYNERVQIAYEILTSDGFDEIEMGYGGATLNECVVAFKPT